MTSLDLPEDDLEFLSDLIESKDNTDEEAFDRARDHIEDSMSSMGAYEHLFKTIGDEIILALASAGAYTDAAGIALYAALLRQDYLRDGIMALAIAYGGVCFHEGYKLAKEEANEP